MCSLSEYIITTRNYFHEATEKILNKIFHMKPLIPPRSSLTSDCLYLYSDATLMEELKLRNFHGSGA